MKKRHFGFLLLLWNISFPRIITVQTWLDLKPTSVSYEMLSLSDARNCWLSCFGPYDVNNAFCSYTHLEKNDIDFGLVTFSWMLTIFIDSLPPPTVVRVFDVFLFEGSKIIFRIAIGMFLMYQNEILKTEERQELYELVKHLPYNLHDVDALFKHAFHDGLHGFSRKLLADKRAKRRAEVKEEMRELNATKDKARLTQRRPPAPETTL
eukprot:m.102481 g.102481  ORF g.102481 m.102481 type:complete len:208 (+) comp13775_c0_seq6:2277-2900(+)